LLIDISLPDGGVEAVLGIAKAASSCKLVVLTALDDAISVSKALADGVKGYIRKGVSGTELVAVIKPFSAACPSSRQSWPRAY
jgi:two-component system nitrate/nitrite response regulator NarL